jgi:hypothetical protein
MNIQRCQAIDARKVFKLRPYKHFGAGGGLFAAVFAGLIFYNVNLLVAGLIAGILGFGLYYYLESRLLVINCPHCKKDINTNTPWECGFQGCENLNVDDFPFVRECEKCHYIPKAYVCHHCGKPLYLTTDQQQAHAARRLNEVKPPVKIKDEIGEKIATQKEEVRDLEHALKKTTIEKQIEIVKNKPAVPPPVKPEHQVILDRIRKAVENGEAVIGLERHLMEEAREKYADDPEGLAEMEKNIQEAIFNEKERRPPGY